jgi:hypothetical protein
VRGHHDQIALSRLGGFDNRLIDLFMLDVERGANNTGQLCGIRNDTKRFFGASFRIFMVFDRGVFEFAWDTERKWNGSVTVTAVILAPISLAKRTPCSTALAARSDPSVDIRMFLNIIVFLWPLFLSVTRRVVTPGSWRAQELNAAGFRGTSGERSPMMPATSPILAEIPSGLTLKN